MSKHDDEGSADPAAPPRAGQQQPVPARIRRGRRARILGWIAVAVAAVLIAASMTVYLKYRAVWDSIHRVAVTDLGHRPPKYTNALNILVFGSDKRSGLSLHQEARLHVGTNQGENNTDTIMVLHISPGRGTVTALSLPRDTEVPVYECAAGPHWTGQQADPGATIQINSLFQLGGPSCLWKTIEQVTGIRIDHFIELSFTGFVKVINDVGGVNVCLPFAVADPNSGLNLPVGQHHINGLTALEFWRTRYSIGNGDDLQRIQRDQYLLAQVFQGILHAGLLSSPTKLLPVVTDAASAMTTDSGMSQSDMLHIAESFHGISSKDVRFITAPNMADPAQPAQVLFQQPQAGQLFHAIAHDRKLPGSAKKKSTGTSAPVLTARPSQVKVKVLNGSGVDMIAGQAAGQLTSRGFDVIGTGDATAFNYTKSVIAYPSAAALPAVNAVKKQVPGATTRKDATLAPGTVELILGSSFTGVGSGSGSSSGPSSSATPTVQSSNFAKSFGGITAATSCHGDRGAFNGPNSP